MNNATTSFLIAIGCLGGLVLLSSCNSCRQNFKAIKSQTSGLNRTVRLFDASGKVIQAWNITSTCESKGNGIWFLDEHEKAVTINGTFIIEEK